jgi:hypothetical protein
MKLLDTVASLLVIVGALNWGLIAVARFDLVAALFGMQFGDVSPLTSTVYVLVGAAAVYQLLAWAASRRLSPAVHPIR